jgi:hypothetical protein
VARPPEEWLVVRDHHEPYLGWEEYWANQERLRANRNLPTGLPRSGPALLSRLLYCGHCGYAMIVHYGRRSRGIAHGDYGCRQGGAVDTPRCHSVSTASVDPPVVQAVLQALAQLTEAAVADALAQERAAHAQGARVHTHALREAEAAVALAERRYKAVDPGNVLVARQLERDYEQALQRRAQLALEQACAPELPPAVAEETDVQALLAVAADVHRVWSHPAVTNEERKEVLRALLDRVVFRESQSGVLELTLHWHGGAVSTVRAYRTAAIKYRILDLWHAGTTVKEIVALLNAEGSRTAQQRPWSAQAVESTLYKHARPTARWQAVQQRIRELHGQGLRCGAIAEQLNAAGLRVLTNEPWVDSTVGIELRVLGLPKPRKHSERSG